MKKCGEEIMYEITHNINKKRKYLKCNVQL